MATRVHSEPLSRVDAAWYHMDSPTNMMMITAVLMFDGPIELQRLKATYEYRMAGRHPRFRCRIRDGGPLGSPHWEEDRRFDINAHVHRVALPAPGDEVALQDMVGDLMSMPLDYRKPPWQVHLIEGYGPDRAGCAVVTRLAHCFADGIALMRILLDLTDDEPDAPWPEPPVSYDYRPPIWTRILVPAMGAVDSTLRVGETMVHEGMETLVHPERLLELARTGAGAAKFGTSYTRALGKLLFIGPDPKTLFRGPLGVVKRAAWTRPIPLADVKAVGKLLCGTVNDVLLASVSGGLRRYLQSRGEDTRGLNIRAMVPVNLRSTDDGDDLGNRFGLIYLSLPVGIEDSQQRLYVLKQRMDDIKRTPEALVAFDILAAIGMTPTQVERQICRLFTWKATAVMTNVPGPRQPVYMAGVPLNTCMFWVPTSAALGLGVSIFSYNGQVTIGISTDAGMAPNPREITAAVEADFAEMQDYVRYVREDTFDQEDFGLPMEARLAFATVGAQVGPELSPVGAAAGRAGGNGQCEAMTRSGQPCRNRSMAGRKTCRVHARI